MASDEKNNTGPEIGLFETWVRKNYGGNSRTKTITSEKYLRICKLIRGEDPNSNAKFRFWVRNKGFRLLRHDKNTDEILDDPCGSLFVSLHAKEGSTPMGERSIEKFLRTNLPAISFFRKVAIVEEFYGIIKCAHVDEKGVHAGQKKTYRLVSDTYAFLPREVITFYLLNCNTCKPRIQKYGPIPSKVRINNLGPRKINSERTPLPNHNEQETYKNETAISHQVIRPSPKRYRPTFIDTVVPETYANAKIYEAQHKSQNINDVPTVHILDSINSPHSRHETNFQQPYIIHGMKKHSEHQAVRGVSSPLRSNEEIYKKNYYNYPMYAVPDTVNGGLKEIRGFQEYTDDNMQGMIDMQDERKKKFESESKAASFSDVITSSNNYRSHYNSNLNSVESEKNMPRHFHGCRMQPYKLLQRNDHLYNYRRHFLESNYNKEIPPHQYCPSYTYLSENKGGDMNLYNENKTSSKIDISSPAIWHKKLNIAGSQVGSWNAVPKHTLEKLQLDTSNIDTAVNNTLMDEFREKYAFDYNFRDNRKFLAHRKENEFCSVNQYHKLVCETVNSSLTALCQPPGVRNESMSHSLKVPDQAKILKVLQETDADELCDSASDSSEV